MSGSSAPKPVPDLVRNIQFTAREGPRANECVTRTIVRGGLRLKQPQHMLGAVRRPRSHDASIRQAQRLRRSHPANMSAATARLPALRSAVGRSRQMRVPAGKQNSRQRRASGLPSSAVA